MTLAIGWGGCNLFSKGWFPAVGAVCVCVYIVEKTVEKRTDFWNSFFWSGPKLYGPAQQRRLTGELGLVSIIFIFFSISINYLYFFSVSINYLYFLVYQLSLHFPTVSVKSM